MNEKSQNPLSSRQAEALLQNRAALSALLSSPETKQLMHLLQRQNGAGLNNAAQRAKQGDLSGLSEMLRQLNQTQAGAAAMRELERKIGK